MSHATHAAGHSAPGIEPGAPWSSPGRAASLVIVGNRVSLVEQLDTGGVEPVNLVEPDLLDPLQQPIDHCRGEGQAGPRGVALVVQPCCNTVKSLTRGTSL